MAGVDLGEKKPTGGGGPSWKRPRVKIRIDMTPMVDIAFLLLIFFMVTTVFRLPQAMEMVLPDKEETTHGIKVQEEKLLTFLVLENDSLAYYVGNKPPALLPWDSLHAKLNERRLAMFNGSPEQLDSIDHFLDLPDAGGIVKLSQDSGAVFAMAKMDLITDQAKVPRIPDGDKQQLLTNLAKIDQLIIMGRIHKKARYHCLVDLVDEFNVARTTRFSIDRFTTAEDSLLHMAHIETSGPAGLPEPEYVETSEGD